MRVKSSGIHAWSRRRIMDYISEGVFQCSSDMRISWFNEPMRIMFGYDSPAEMHMLGVDDLFAEQQIASALNERFTGRKEVRGLRVLLRRKDQSNFLGLLDWFPGHHDGRLVFDGIITNLTEVTRWENELREKNDVIYRTRSELDTFIYRASHDLRSPISSMEGILHLHHLETREEMPYNNVLVSCLNQLKGLVDQLTSFSRNTHERVRDERISFDTILESVFMELTHHKKFGRVHKSVEINSEAVFFSDPFRIKLIIEIIVTNAYVFHDINKYKPEITVTVNTFPEKAVIDVFDNGMGIAKAYIDQVFEMFFRGTTDAKGSGIGLYIAKEAVRVLHGTISLKSEFGIGTSVSITIPNSDKGRLIELKNLRRQKHGRR